MSRFTVNALVKLSTVVMVLTVTLTGTLVQTGAATSGTWAQVSTGTPPGREFAAMTYDSRRGYSVLFGGAVNYNSNFADTWEWNGTVWTQRAPAQSPPGLIGHAMAYDSRRGRTVLFGGSAANVNSAATWEWDGSTWVQRTLAVSPSARLWHAMAYDSTRGRIVLFGGSQGASDTWEFDGNTWTQVFPLTSPTSRYGHAMAFDSIRNRVVLFGGNAFYGRSAETWEWDGTNWTERISAAKPYARFWHTLAFDSRQGVTVLFGGDHVRDYGLGPINDTWLWDGSQWTQIQAPYVVGAPGYRMEQTMAYDSARGRTVMFGGTDAGYPVPIRYTDTWELSTTTAVKADQTITFNQPYDQIFGAPPFAVAATSSSGLPVTLTAAGQCTVTGSTVTITGGGSCSITAAQLGNADYNPAVPVTRTFNIACFPLGMTFAVPVGSAAAEASLEFPSQQPVTGGGCTGTFNLYSIGLYVATLVGTGTFSATTLGSVVTASMVGALVPPLNAVTFNATLTLDVATQTGTIVEVFATPDGPVTITVTFAKVAHAYVITGVTVTP